MYVDRASQGALAAKNLPASVEEIRKVGWIPEFGGGPGNPLQYSCLENPMNRGAQSMGSHGLQSMGSQKSQT